MESLVIASLGLTQTDRIDIRKTQNRSSTDRHTIDAKSEAINFNDSERLRNRGIGRKSEGVARIRIHYSYHSSFERHLG